MTAHQAPKTIQNMTPSSPFANPTYPKSQSAPKPTNSLKYALRPNIRRIWFYVTAPASSISYVCEISPARTRNPGNEPLLENGLGNREFNERHKDWDGYDYAFEILSVYKLHKPATLAEMKGEHRMKSAPQGLVYTPKCLPELVDWETQEKLR